MSSRDRAFRFPVSILIGSSPSNILRVTRGHRIALRYYPKLLLTFIVSLVFGMGNIRERARYRRKIASVSLQNPPVFIIGFWRSGTTLLHSLMCQDRRAGYVTTFHAVFPNLILTQKRWLKSFTNAILPKKRPFDAYPMDMDFPQEEDFALMSLQPRSLYKMFYFPKDFDTIYNDELYFEKLPEKCKKRWEEKYQEMIRKAMLNTGGERYVSKNPCNIFRIKTLVKLFPGAKFIFIYRNPYQVVESLTRFVNEILPGSELQHLEGGLQRENFARLYKDSLNEYLKAKAFIKAENLTEIRYEEFKERPVEFLRDVYTQFELPGFDESLTMMESYLAKNNPESRAKYPVPPETYRLVNEFAGDIVKRLGYDLVEYPEKAE